MDFVQRNPPRSPKNHLKYHPPRWTFKLHRACSTPRWPSSTWAPITNYPSSNPKMYISGQMAISWVLFQKYPDSKPEICDFGQIVFSGLLFQKYLIFKSEICNFGQMAISRVVFKNIRISNLHVLVKWRFLGCFFTNIQNHNLKSVILVRRRFPGCFLKKLNI